MKSGVKTVNGNSFKRFTHHGLLIPTDILKYKRRAVCWHEHVHWTESILPGWYTNGTRAMYIPSYVRPYRMHPDESHLHALMLTRRRFAKQQPIRCAPVTDVFTNRHICRETMEILLAADAHRYFIVTCECSAERVRSDMREQSNYELIVVSREKNCSTRETLSRLAYEFLAAGVS